MYFKVYHKKSRQLLTTFNENTIVDFCVSNKDSVKNYYFSVDGQKDMMDWEVFAVKHSDLFEKKADERDQKEFKKAKDEQEIDTGRKNTRLGFSMVLMALLFATYLTYYLYQKTLEQDMELRMMAMSNDVQLEKKAPIEKRPQVPSDKAFRKESPTEKELKEIWKKSKKIPASLGFNEIKEQMDLYLPALKECYQNRAKEGDTTLRGTINMKIRVTGDGMVRDVLFTDEKYQSTLFGDCIVSAIKSTPFKAFKSREQVFSYYWNL